jgi:hypothetical protein
MTLIADITATAATSLSFTSIPSTYKHLLLTANGTQSADAQGWGIRFNNSSATNYSYGGFYNDRPTTTVQVLEGWNSNGFGTGNPSKFGLILSYPNATYGNSAGAMWIYDYADATNQKTVTWDARGAVIIGGGAYGRGVTASATYEELAAIDRIDFIRSSTQTFTGIVRLYGVS